MTARSPAGGPARIEAQATKPRSSVIWVQGLACGALLTFAAPTALLLAILFAPAAICPLLEPTKTGLTRAVALGCAAASLGPAWRLWTAGDRMDQALASLSDPGTISLAWGAGACAWALCQVLPVILARSWEVREASRIRAIEAEIKEVQDIWSMDDN